MYKEITYVPMQMTPARHSRGVLSGNLSYK